MNSQIYCLPQKYGWNSLTEHSPNRVAEQQKYLAKKTPTPYFRIDLDRPCKHDEIPKIYRRFQKLNKPESGDPCRLAGKYVNTTEMDAEYSAFEMFPRWPKKQDTTLLARQSDPPIPAKIEPRRAFKLPIKGPSMDTLMWGRCPAMRMVWPPPHDVQEDIWRKSATYARQQQEQQEKNLKLERDRQHEKERWDTLTWLSRQDALPYQYRRKMPGFTGHETVQCGAQGENLSMVASTRAVHRPFPAHEYSQKGQGHHHQGPMSRTVTLTHPFNPYSQQSAYPSVSATGTQ